MKKLQASTKKFCGRAKGEECCDAYRTYFFGGKQESLDWVKVWEKLCFFNNMHSIFITDSFVQGSSI